MTEKVREEISPRIFQIILLESKSLFDGEQSVSDWNQSFISAYKSSAAHVQAGLQVRGLAEKDSQEQNEKDLIETLSLPGVKLGEATAGLNILEGWRSDVEVVTAYKQAAGSVWSEATAFRTS